MKFEKVGTITINDKKWSYGWGDAGKTKGKPNDGICNYEQRKIIIRRNPSRSFADVFCHELAHARFPDLTEDAVDEFGGLMGEFHKTMLKSIAIGGSASRCRR